MNRIPVFVLPLALLACGGGGGGGGTDESTDPSATTASEPAVLEGVVETTVTTPVGTSSRAIGVALQPDGRIVVCGQSDSDFLVVRYLPDGSLDTTFGGTGAVVTAVSAEEECAFGVQVDAAGRIVVAGFAKVGGISKCVLARYLADGTLDWIAMPAVGDSTKEAGFYALQLQADGKILAAGQAYIGGLSRIPVVRFNDDGSLDSTYGAAGIASVAFGAWHSGGKVLMLDGSGRAVAAGWVAASGGEGTNLAVVRFDVDGQPDTTFNSTGHAHVDFGNLLEDHAYGLALQGTNIIAAGNTNNGSEKDGAVVCLEESGALKWKITWDYSSSTDSFADLIVGSDQEIYVCGTVTVASTTLVTSFFLGAIDADGNWNPAFGTNGFVLTAVEGRPSTSLQMEREADGRVVQVGVAGSELAWVRYR